MSKLLLLFQSKLATAILGALLFLGTMAVQISTALSTTVAPASTATPTGYRPSSEAIAWDFTNPEVEQMIDELRRERAQVKARAQELAELELRITTDRTELDTLIANVRKLQAEFDASILRVQQEESANLKKLAKVYANMEPANAIGILKELDDYSLVKILLFMKEQETAPILENLAKLGPGDARRAAGLSESLRTATVAKVGAPQPGPTNPPKNQ